VRSDVSNEMPQLPERGQLYRHLTTGVEVKITGTVGQFVQFDGHRGLLRLKEFNRKYVKISRPAP
jgi:hypothetical protein